MLKPHLNLYALALVGVLSLPSPFIFAAPSAEQGEEVYTEKPATTLPKTRTAPPAPVAEEPPAAPSVASPAPNAPKATAPTPQAPAAPVEAPAPVETVPAPATTTNAPSTPSAPTPSSGTSESSSTPDEEKEDLTVKQNQLVQGDEAPFAIPKQNGILWFAGIFIVFIIIIFVFI